MIKTDGLRSISVTYVTELLNEAPLNMNKTDGTQGRHKDAEVFKLENSSRQLIRKLKRSGPAIKSHHSNALRDYLNITIEECSHEKPCGKCWACWLHGMMKAGKSNIYTSITASDALSVEDKEIALTGLDENMLRARMGEGSSPQPFGYERLRAGTHITGSIAINTGYRPSQTEEGKDKKWSPISKVVDKEHLRALFWYGVYCALTNEGYAQTAKTGQHNTKMRPIQLIAIETFKTPFPSCTRVDYSSTSVEDVLSNHASYAKYITDMRLFSWNDISGDDKERFLKYLKDDVGIEWAEDPEINKSDGGKTIIISKERNSIEMTIDENEEKATLKISDDRIHDLKVEKKDGKLTIYAYISSMGFDCKQDVEGWSVLSKNGEERGRIKVMSGDDAYKFLIDQAEKIHTVPQTP